jgi:hypothetical protein
MQAMALATRLRRWLQCTFLLDASAVRFCGEVDSMDLQPSFILGGGTTTEPHEHAVGRQSQHRQRHAP